MQQFKENLFDVDNLSPELAKIKTDLENRLEAGLDAIDSRAGWTWVQKNKASINLKQQFEDFWTNVLTKAGIVVAPVFESTEEDSINSTLAEEFRMYENLWKENNNMKNSFAEEFSLYENLFEEDLSTEDLTTLIE